MVGDIATATLAEFVQYVPLVQELKLDTTDLDGIRVRGEPPPHEDFLSLGELLPGAPIIGHRVFPFVGTRHLYVARSDLSPRLWNRLASGLAAHRPSGAGGTSMFGNDDERWIDEGNPALSWRRINAGQ